MNFFKSKITETENSLIKLQEEFDTVNESFENARNESISLSEKLATMTSEFNRVSEENTALKAQLETVNSEIVEVTQEAADVNALATSKAIDILASVGTAPVEVVEEQETATDVIKEFRKLKGAEAQAYFNENKQAIYKALKN